MPWLENKEIVLKDGYNVKLILGLILSIGMLLGFLSSKYLLPDDREILHKNQDVRLYMGQVQVYTPKYYDYDEEKGLLQARFTERHQTKNIGAEQSIVYSVYDPDQNAYPYVVTSSSCKEDEENPNVCYTNVIVQVIVPDNFYGVLFQIMQEETSIETVHVDYREVRKKTFREKGENYYPEIEEIEQAIAEYEAQADQLNKEWAALKKNKDKTLAINEKRDELMAVYEQINELKNARGRALRD